MTVEGNQRLIELVSRTQKGDRDARDALLREAARRASRLIGAFSGYAEDEADILQNVLKKVYLGVGKLVKPEAFGAWLARIVQGETRLFLRRRYREDAIRAGEQGLRMEDFPSRDSAGSFLEPLIEDHLSVLRREIEGLAGKYRDVLMRTIIEKKEMPEVAAEMGISLSAVTARHYRGIEKVRSRLRRLP